MAKPEKKRVLVPVKGLMLECSYLVNRQRCRETATSAVGVGNNREHRCEEHEGLVIGTKKGPIFTSVWRDKK